MKPSEVLPRQRNTIRQLVIEAGMTNPRVFGSVARGEDNEESDLDILVDAGPGVSLLTMVQLKSLLESATGVKVDLQTPGDLHPGVRDRVLAEAAAL